MGLRNRTRVRNADKARNSFVTRRTETKLSALADMFKGAAGGSWVKTETRTLRRTLYFSDFRYLESMALVYNWENRFMAVNYNLQMIGVFFTDDKEQYEEVGDARFTLHCKQEGLKGKRSYHWDCTHFKGEEAVKEQYLERLSHPFILQRLNDLDIFEMEIRHKGDWDYWRVSCESLIGSATWMLIPPVLSMITPKMEECVKFYELYELLGDALVNNKPETIEAVSESETPSNRSEG